MHEEGLIDRVLVVQSFDLDAALSLKNNHFPHQVGATYYASHMNSAANASSNAARIFRPTPGQVTRAVTTPPRPRPRPIRPKKTPRNRRASGPPSSFAVSRAPVAKEEAKP